MRRQKDGEARHSTLRDTVETSFRLMTPELQDAFGMLSVFRGGWSLEAAEAVLGVSGAVLLAELRDRSLISAVEVRDGDTSVMRYHLLETLREFADETAPAELKEVAQLRHATYFSTLAQEECGNFLRFRRDTRPIRVLESEFANITAAAEFLVERSEPEMFKRVLDVITAMRHLWTRRSLSFLTPWARRVGERLDSVPEALWGDALTAASLVMPPPEAEKLIRQVVAWHEARGQENEAANTMHYLAYNLEHQGRLEEGLEMMRAAAERFACIGNLAGERNALASVAGFLRDLKRWDEAVPLWTALVETARASGDDHGVAKVSLDLAMVAVLRGDLERAPGLALEALATFERRGEQWNIASSYRILARVREAQGDREATIQCLQTAADTWRATGYGGHAGEADAERERVLAGQAIGWR